MNAANTSEQLPGAFAKRMQQQLGDRYPAYCTALDKLPSTSIRINPFKAFQPPSDLQPVSWCEHGYYLKDRPKFHRDPFWHAGAYYVQEASSMFLETIYRQLRIHEHPIVLDACAAPGGKSTHLLSLMNGKGMLVANEIISKRNAILVENVMKWGVANQVATQMTIPELKAFGPRFDIVVADAPCSGEGLFRKDSKAIQEWSEQHVRSCAQRQQLILSDLAECVLPGGYLIYSTCTYSEAENEEQVELLLDTGAWDLVPIQPADGQSPAAGKNGIGWRFYPHQVNGEGFFAACLQKKGSQITSETLDDNSVIPDWLRPWIDADRMKHLVVKNWRGNFHLFPGQHLPLLEKLDALGKVRYFGIPAGELIHGDLKPAHGLALSTCVSSEIPILELDLGEAVRYLGKETYDLTETVEKGWNLIRYKGVNLGWAKVLNNRINNYYPKSWSIRP